MKVEDVTKLIKNINVDQIVPDSANPNEMTEDEMDRLAKSLDVYGFLYPVIIDKNNKIIDGHHRFFIYQRKGLKQVPCITMEFKSESERRLLRQSLNKIHGVHEEEKDLAELELIIKDDAQLLEELIGVTQDDIDTMKKALEGAEPHFQTPADDDIEEENEKFVLHIPVSEELLSQIKHLMKEKDISDYEELLEWFISQVRMN